MGTSPIAATPAGSDNTPDPTAPLMRLKAAAAIVCSLLLLSDLDETSSLPSLIAADAAAEDVIRMAPPPVRLRSAPPASPPRGRDNTSLFNIEDEEVVEVIAAVANTLPPLPPIKKASAAASADSIATKAVMAFMKSELGKTVTRLVGVAAASVTKL